ncbi:DUF3558 family protein [Umezawaea beigongshangensis]|uniref:DUF3558 family protein n=1 Tax=Umezawaea beigongshangensis TaxID=2780383 RepID=UPI0018F14362|nr:DUF3558 family protein [Umezawaea beigongshangensis]
MTRPHHRATAVAAVVCALTVLSGCATGPDLAKKTYPRSTVPVAENVTGSGTPTSGGNRGAGRADPAFAPDQLRLLDPCALFDNEVLRSLGRPADTTPSSFSECANYMVDKQGEDLSISIKLGETMTSEVEKADRKIGGLPSVEQTLDDTACFVHVITQDEPGLGITVQIGYKEGDPCVPGRAVAESVVRQIADGAEKITPAKGSLVSLDPCALPEQGVVAEAAGDAPKTYPYGLHNCSWISRTAEISVNFRTTFVPDGNAFEPGQQPVDLNGTPAFQLPDDGAFPSCEVFWLQRESGGTEGELVEVKSSGPKESQFDRCARAQAFAKALLPKIPKP